MRNLFKTILLIVVASAQAQSERFTMEQIGNDHLLNYPWEIIYGPDDMLWITERAGKRVVRINPNNGDRDELITIPEVYQASTQDGLLGMALHPELGLGKGTDYVYLSYTYQNNGRKQKLIRYRYSTAGADGSLSDPVDLITGMPASNDHNSGRLIFGPDSMLYYSIGDQGKNQYENVCLPIMAQTLPTQKDIDNQDWNSYQGKILRINPDGTIPQDNPILDGVQSHIYSYGHRNPQGLVFTRTGQLYSAEHGPKSDDELNRIIAGKNYGWPHVAGYIDDQAYEYCQWASAENCNSLSFDDFGCPTSAIKTSESSWGHSDFIPPVQTFYTVEDDYNFIDPECNIQFICWPTIAPSSLDFYGLAGIPGWDHSLLIVGLKTGKIYRLPMDVKGEATGEPIVYWDTQNRYRDMAIHPNGKTFYIITDNFGQTSGPSSGNTSTLKNPGTILKFEYQGEPLTINSKGMDKTEITLWPNPASQWVAIQYPENLKMHYKEIRILNIQGKEEYSTVGTYQEAVFDINKFTDGLYFIQTAVDGIVLTKRFIVEH